MPEAITLKTNDMSNNWQTCPKCHGQGYVWFPPNLPMNPTMTGDGTPYECDICKGKKIINSANGLPPDESTPKQIEAEKGKELPTDEEIDKQFPVDPEEIMDGLKMPSDFKHSQEIRDCLAPIVDSNYNKRFGAKWMRSKLQSLPKEPTPEKCEKCPFFKFYKEPTTKLRDELIKFVKYYFQEEQCGPEGSSAKMVDEYLNSKEK